LSQRRNYACAVICAIGAILLFVVIILVYLSYQARYRQRLLENQGYLWIIRREIQFFFEQNGRYPNSLDEFRSYALQHNSHIWDKMYIDLTSDKQSDVPEYRELNDKGGYYYDPNTGDIKLNLTRPVKEYLPHYHGRFKDKTPSSW
jgi:hypothetical protein